MKIAYVKCSRCGIQVSNACGVNDDEELVVRAFVECADCIAKQPDWQAQVAKLEAQIKKWRAKIGKPAMKFESGTGLMGATATGQVVTKDNVGELPPGSVVRIGDGSRLIHLHDSLWLWCSDHAGTYDRIENLAWRLDDNSVACHVSQREAS